MTIAELHGKLNPDTPRGANERMEDLLTSDVFGTMKYAGWNKGFVNWIQQAEAAPVDPHPQPIKELFHGKVIQNIKYRFWPRLENGREPDIAILIHFNNQEELLIIVEAKYFSGTSDWEDEEIAEKLEMTGSQLADQVIGTDRMLKKELLAWFETASHVQDDQPSSQFSIIHLYVTKHIVLPVSDYENASKKTKGYWPLKSYWLSWNSLYSCIKPYRNDHNVQVSALITDLYDLLVRKGLKPFTGFAIDFPNIVFEQPSFWNESYWSFPPFESKIYSPFFSDDN